MKIFIEKTALAAGAFLLSRKIESANRLQILLMISYLQYRTIMIGNLKLSIYDIHWKSAVPQSQEAVDCMNNVLISKSPI